MIPLNDEQLKRYRYLLSLQLRRLPRDRCAQARYDSSDIVQSVLLKAHKNRANFRGQTEAELVGWLQTILKREVIEFWRRLHADKCDPACERQLQQDLAESSACLENYLADKELSPASRRCATSCSSNWRRPSNNSPRTSATWSSCAARAALRWRRSPSNWGGRRSFKCEKARRRQAADVYRLRSASLLLSCLTEMGDSLRVRHRRRAGCAEHPRS